ncbi:hypothetical protein Hypma_007273 [Hypsizygus marmoreus]|uniref:Uncharacterized protein n=1 Tax=Hypsizygus marmoreus TaxID=39966 RepID=A0A369K7D7_HYPMA|nr:hypothetical protein Hypma_007273 [Hypsizygus marmoreus]
MGVIYDWTGDTPEVEHRRLVALRQLTAHVIPCILWGEDALSFAHSVPTWLFDQQILVPDELLDAAAIILEQGKYKRTSTPNRNFMEVSGPHKGAYAFPRSIRLLHSDIPEDEPYKLEPIPQHILLLPQSYYGLDVRSTFRFQSLVPPLDSSNAGILVPKYNTFLEGLVEIIVNPPTGHWHRASKATHDIFIGYLTLYRIKPDLDLPEPPELRPIERDILSEIQTEDCAWYMDILLSKRDSVRMDALEEYKRQKLRRERESNGKDSIVNSVSPFRKGGDAIYHQTTRRYSTSQYFTRYATHPSSRPPTNIADHQPVSTANHSPAHSYLRGSSSHSLIASPSRTLFMVQRFARRFPL